MNFTPVTDSFGRSVQISSEKFSSTFFAGLLPVGHLANQLNLFDAVDNVLTKDIAVKVNAMLLWIKEWIHHPEVPFRQRKRKPSGNSPHQMDLFNGWGPAFCT